MQNFQCEREDPFKSGSSEITFRWSWAVSYDLARFCAGLRNQKKCALKSSQVSETNYQQHRRLVTGTLYSGKW